jgi:hypothetical protein
MLFIQVDRSCYLHLIRHHHHRPFISFHLKFLHSQSNSILILSRPLFKSPRPFYNSSSRHRLCKSCEPITIAPDLASPPHPFAYLVDLICSVVLSCFVIIAPRQGFSRCQDPDCCDLPFSHSLPIGLTELGASVWGKSCTVYTRQRLHWCSCSCRCDWNSGK